MEVISVATHNERYFDSFIDSLSKYNIKPTILGWNQSYTGHLMKDDLLEKYLTKNNKKRVVIFCDAFDSILVKNPNNLYKDFLKTKKKMIVSNEETDSSFIREIQKFFFGTVNNQLINTGLIIGYSDIFLKCLKIIKKYRRNDINSNQKIWTIAMSKNNFLKKSISIDNENNFFNNNNSFSKKLLIKNSMLYNKSKKSYPYFIQANGNNDLNYYCNKLNIKQSSVYAKDIIKYNTNFLYYYILPYKYYIITFFIILILCFTKIKNLKK